MPDFNLEPGSIVVIEGEEHRFGGHAAGRMQLHHLVTGALLVVADDAGAVGLPTDESFASGLREGRIFLRMPPSKLHARISHGVPGHPDFARATKLSGVGSNSAKHRRNE